MRQISLPEAIDHQRIQAKCCEGVLEVILPKASDSASRKIEVKGG